MESKEVKVIPVFLTEEGLRVIREALESYKYVVGEYISRTDKYENYENYEDYERSTESYNLALLVEKDLKDDEETSEINSHLLAELLKTHVQTIDDQVANNGLESLLDVGIWTNEYHRTAKGLIQKLTGQEV